MSIEGKREQLIHLRKMLPVILSREEEALKQCKAQKTQFIRDMEIAGKASEVMRELQDTVSKSTVGFLSDFLTRGVDIVFPDKGIVIEVEVGDRGSRKTANILIVQKVDSYVIRVDINNGVGGGIQVVVAFLLQVLVILNQNLNRTIFLDEAFTQVSREYTETLGSLFDLLKDEFGFKILLITHDVRFEDMADSVYSMQNGKLKKER